MSSRSEHRLAGQRTSFESPRIILEHVHDAVDHFLRETHAPPVDIGYDRTKVDGRLGFDEGCGGLGFDEGGGGLGLDEGGFLFVKERFAQPSKCAAWRLWLEILASSCVAENARRLLIVAVTVKGVFGASARAPVMYPVMVEDRRSVDSSAQVLTEESMHSKPVPSN